MSVETADLLSPAGRLQAAVLWPGVSPQTVSTKLDAFLAEAVTKTATMTAGATQDSAQKAWAYYRAYDEVYQRLVALPSSATFADEGSASTSATQMTLMRDLRDQALAEFTALVAITVLDPVIPANRFSRSTRAAFEF